jgi:hypothetical protein
MTTLMQILGWIEHCERELPDKATCIPTWLCSWEAFQDSVSDGWVEQKNLVPMIPRLGVSQVVYRLSDKGRVKFFSSLPRAEQPAQVHPHS